MIRELLIAFFVTTICVVIHITGIVLLGDQLIRRRREIERRINPVFSSLLLLAIFSTVTLLHVGEAVVWAAFYYWGGLLPDLETAIYYSMKSYSTVGYGDVLLPHEWRLLGTMEAVSGVLMCGLSAAFLFTVVNALFRFRIQRLEEARDVGGQAPVP